MFLEILNQPRQNLLKKIVMDLPVQDSYLAVGTGLALMLGHRESKKFPNANINYYHMIKSLAYFEDADHEANPVMLKPMNWLEIKEFFKLKQRDLLKRLF